jgi:phage repressor protein C with HTH and peptisase S24 domain
MDDTAERLQWLRKKGGLPSKSTAAKAYGIAYEIYKKMESGERSLTREHAETIALWHTVSRGWLMFGEGTPEGEVTVPLIGEIGGGQEVSLFPGSEEHYEPASALIASHDAVAFRVRGNSMYPLAHDGDLIFIGPPRRGRDMARLIGKECGVLLEDGRRFFKVLERGSRDGLYDLHSYNAEPLRGVEVHSAGAFQGLKRR